MSSHLFQNSYPQAQPYGSEPLAFFGSNPSGSSTSPYYPASRTSLEGNVGGGPSSYASGSMGSMGNMGNMGNMGSMGSMSGARLGGMMASEGRWWEAFGTGGFEGEPSLMEGELHWMLTAKSHASRASLMLMCARAELGINPGHILQKSLTVLNPLSKVNAHIMDDADLAGPFVFCFAFAFVLLLVS